jgi:hypothetical protein
MQTVALKEEMRWFGNGLRQRLCFERQERADGAEIEQLKRVFAGQRAPGCNNDSA